MINCIHSQHGICQIATRLIHRPVPLNKKACEFCQKDVIPMAVNRVTASLAVHMQMMSGVPIEKDLILIAKDQFSLAGYCLARRINKWLKLLRLTLPQNCGCEEWVIKMNRWGFQGSLDHLDEIVEHLVSNFRMLYPVAMPFITKPLITRMVRKCLLKERS